jgi:hypothetical protein
MARLQLLATVACLTAGAIAAAQEAAVPTVVVAGFSTAPRANFRDRDAAALGEALAARLAESGRYRVLDRVWLAGESSQPLPASALRARALAAGVDYVFAGRIERRVHTYRVVEPVRPGASVFRGARGLRPGIAGIPRVHSRRVESTLVQSELLDVATGAVVKEFITRIDDDPGSRLAPAAALALAGASPIAAAAVAIAQRRRSTATLNPALEKVVNDIAAVLIATNAAGLSSPASSR